MCLLTPVEEWIRGEPLTEEHWSSQMSQALRTASNGAPGTLYLSFTLFLFLSLPHWLSIAGLSVSICPWHSAPITLCESNVTCVNCKTDKSIMRCKVHHQRCQRDKVVFFLPHVLRTRFIQGVKHFIVLHLSTVRRGWRRRRYFKGILWHFEKYSCICFLAKS